MIQINNAILHIFDYAHGSLVLSESVLSSEDRTMLHFVTKQIDKLLHSPAIRQGEFEQFSTFQPLIDDYASENMTLLDLSKHLARKWYDVIQESDKIDNATLLVCDIYDNANHYLAALKYKNRNSFQYIAQMEEGKRINKVIENISIIPNSAQSVDECFLIHLDTRRIYFKDVKRVIKQEETWVIPSRLLQCTQELSCQDVLKTIDLLGQQFSETYELDRIQTMSRTKDYLQKQIQDDGYLHTPDLANFVFSENEAMANEFLQSAEEMMVPPMVRLHEKFVNSKSKSQKLKLDNGIELVLPAAFYDDPEQFEIVKNEDDTVNIILKNIKEIK